MSTCLLGGGWSFIGVGRSGHDDTSERHKEILAQAFAPKSAEDV